TIFETNSNQEIYAQFSTVYPEAVANATITPRSDEIETRAVRDWYCCPIAGGPWQGADVGRIKEGITYLTNLNAYCDIGGGSAKCARVSCSNKSAIWLCNDNAYGIAPSCTLLANYSASLTPCCTNAENIARGQSFDTDNFNVIVRLDSC
ncbi:hypothetical protein BDZ45DRAFT_768815, partial [Acephala macrosclerotiorum]